MNSNEASSDQLVRQLQNQIEELRSTMVQKDYLSQIVTKISTLLIKTEKGVFKRTRADSTPSLTSEDYKSERSFSNGSDEFAG